MLPIGSRVRDLLNGTEGEVRSALLVPRGRDLFGHEIPPHYRYCLVYPRGPRPGSWSNDRTDADLAPVGV